MTEFIKFLPLLHRLTSVVIAEFASDRRLLYSNAGFRRIHADSRLPAWCLFIQPRLEDLLNTDPDADGRIYEGLMTLGDAEGESCTVSGAVFFGNEGITVLAGYDMDELEAVPEHLRVFNRQLAETQRELGRNIREIARREHEHRMLALTDPLTGIGNRRSLDAMLKTEVERARRYGAPVSLTMLDIDHFKHINDYWGHDAGDLVLKEVGVLLKKLTRSLDTVTRMGGDEFVVLMPGATLDAAIAATERIRHELERHCIKKLPPFTASFGVASLNEGESGHDLLYRADGAMYEAKHEGRNRLAVAHSLRRQK